MISHPLVVVTATVLLGLVSAVLLKEASSDPNVSWLMLSLIILAVFFVNGLKFILWGIAHRNHPISSTYLINSLFFPLIFIVSHLFYGEQVTFQKMVGIALIVVGVAVITCFDNSGSEGMR